MENKLSGKTIFVTGASSGIGQQIAIHCAHQGAKLIISGQNSSRLNQTLEQLKGVGHEVIEANLLTDVPNIVQQLPVIEGLVHAAGCLATLPVKFMRADKLAHTMELNFTAPTMLTQLMYKQNKLSSHSSVVFISSIAGNSVFAAGSGMYSASKAALSAMAKCMAVEFAAQQIRVNSICPGLIETPLINNGALTPEMLEQNKQQYPLKRFGTTQEVADACVFLLSSESSFITGANLVIDGGYSLQ